MGMDIRIKCLKCGQMVMMPRREFEKKMKKPHPCKSNSWEIIRMGMDIRIKCLKCGQMVMMPRREFEKKMKKVLTKAEETVE